MKSFQFAILLFIIQPLYAQKMPSDYFDEAMNYYENSNFDSAYAAYQFIVDHYPKDELFPKAFYNTGYISFVQKKYDKAIPVFRYILNSDFNEKEERGGGIMDDPYTNFRHWSCIILSKIYTDNAVYDTALYYFALGDTAYPYLHFCGNELAANEVYTALGYAEIYKQMNQPDRAIEKLLPVIFEVLTENKDVIIELKSLLCTKKNVRKEFDDALKNMYPKEFKQDDRSYRHYYFRFHNAEIEVPDSYENDEKEFHKSDAIKEIHESEFYKMIKEL